MGTKDAAEPGRVTIQLPEAFLVVADRMTCSRSWLARAVLERFGADEAFQRQAWESMRARAGVAAPAAGVTAEVDPFEQAAALTHARKLALRAAAKAQVAAEVEAAEVLPIPTRPRPWWMDDGCQHDWRRGTKAAPQHMRRCAVCHRGTEVWWTRHRNPPDGLVLPPTLAANVTPAQVAASRPTADWIGPPAATALEADDPGRDETPEAGPTPEGTPDAVPDL